jgi:hypothetical protein
MTPGRNKMKGRMLALGLTAALAGGSYAVIAAGDQAVPPCCAKRKATATKAVQGKMRCTLTGKVVDKCCCEQREGKTYCPLANKTVEKCCCVPAEEKAAKS